MKFVALIKDYRLLKRIKRLIKLEPNSLNESKKDLAKVYKLNFNADCLHFYDLNHPDSYINEVERWLVRYKLDQGYQCLFDNKILFSKVFGNILNVPKCYYSWWKSRLYDWEGKVASKLSLEPGDYVLKPATASRSAGVRLISFDGASVHIDGESKSFSEFVDFLKQNYKDAVLCEKIRNIKYAADIAPKSTNTIRVITYFDQTMPEPRIAAAIHRFGVGGLIDGADVGGVFAKIDLETGALYKAMSHKLRGQFEKHPVFGTQIEGVKIPYWEEIKAKAINAHRHFPYIELIGWDVCLADVEGESKIYAIEANASSDFDWIQAYGGLADSDFGSFLFRHGCKYGR